ncbi:MAG: hypothetical protein HY420_01395 [Candidatus Kerfeldbacteria bacterium]|nr:hypothetical protein [Candidatus Kerfeldbacteria bacterium]
MQMQIESTIGKEIIDLSWLFPIRGLEHSEVANRRRRLIECIGSHFERTADFLCLTFPERLVSDNDFSLDSHISPQWKRRAYLPRNVYQNSVFGDRCTFWYFILEGLLERYEGVGVMLENGSLTLEFGSPIGEYRMHLRWQHPAHAPRRQISLTDVTPKPETEAVASPQ